MERWFKSYLLYYQIWTFKTLDSMKNILARRNPYLLFSPFMIFFIILVFILYTDVKEGDEAGYISFSENLLNGYYSPSAPDIDLWWGPGYPIILMPFIAFHFPLICIALLNAVFQYLSIVLLYKTILQSMEFRMAIFVSLFWAFCYSSYPYMASIITESFTVFLISLLVFSIMKAFNDGMNKYLYLSGFIIGYIALTKVIFGYVILILLLGTLILWIFNRNIKKYRKALLIMLIALITTMPYLLYTYNLTGRFFYWGNSGGMSLYWMSTPYENEYGSWDNESFTAAQTNGDNSGNITLQKSNHQKDLDYILQFKGVQRDDAYKRIALNNIKTYPEKYLRNIVANIYRMLFGFPVSYTYQGIHLKVIYFSILFTLMVFCIIPTVVNWKMIPFPIRFLLAFGFVYLGGSSLISAGNRQFVIIVPLLLLWIAYIISKSVSLRMKFYNG